ncbi:MAG: hypothetical protein ACLQSR_12800 [Limisphaerales bacterium]
MKFEISSARGDTVEGLIQNPNTTMLTWASVLVIGKPKRVVG